MQKLILQRRVSSRVLRHHDNAGCVAIDSVDNEGTAPLMRAEVILEVLDD
jgi:hypothetical protein